MDVIIEPEAEEDLREIEKDSHRSFIRKRLKELEGKPTNHENSKLIRAGDQQVYRYTMKKGKKGGKDYRTIYDIIEGEIRAVSIFHRDQGYQKTQLTDRLP